MKFYATENIKNITLVGGAKAGKTTLAECMMFEGGVITRMGSVEDKNTVSDYHEVEHERGNSVFSSILHTEWRGTKINIIDTPGMDDFIGEVIPSLRVADTALLLINAQSGVEVGTEIVMRYLRKYKKPTIMVVNQMDGPKADFDVALTQIRDQFEENVVVMQYPYNYGENFNCIIDLLKMVMYKFPPEGGKPEKVAIPDEEKEKANKLHNTLVEAAAENDESLMELYFEEGELNEDQMRQGLRQGMLNRDLIPLFCLSAKRNMGSGRLMGFLGNVAPTAGEIAAETAKDGSEINISDPETTLFVFKAANEKHAGQMSYFKVCSGEVIAGMEMTNVSSQVKGKLNQLYAIDGKNRNPVDKLAAGDIGATVKFKNTHVNHTLRSTDDEVEIDPIVFPSPRIRVSIAPTKTGDEEKMGAALRKMHESDPSLIMELSKELRQTLLHAQGDLHLNVAKWILEKEHGVPVEYGKPRISYRETIRKEVKADYRHKKQTGGAGQFGEVHMIVHPYTEGMEDTIVGSRSDIKVREVDVHELPWGGKLLFCNCIVGGSIDNRFMPAIMKGIMEVMEQGPLTKSYARDIVVLVYDGKMHPVDSNEAAFKSAGKNAFKSAFLNAKPYLMEPIYTVEVLTPGEYMGDIMTDLQGRRALVEGMSAEGNLQKVIAKVPLAELYKYTTSLASIAQGRALYSREFAEYKQVPGDVQEILVKENSKEEE